MPGFHLDTPSQDMGALAEHVRTRPDAVRSGHPQTSFAAVGKRAKEFMDVHDLDCHLGPRSPLGALYEADAQVLLLGVEYDVCIAFHLAEYRLARAVARRAYTCFVMRNGQRERLVFMAEHIYDYDFADLGAALAERTDAVATGRVGGGQAKVFDMRRAVDFAIGWMDGHRGPS
jgi:aminoglycoside 3-N-acetyltransferase